MSLYGCTIINLMRPSLKGYLDHFWLTFTGMKNMAMNSLVLTSFSASVNIFPGWIPRSGTAAYYRVHWWFLQLMSDCPPQSFINLHSHQCYKSAYLPHLCQQNVLPAFRSLPTAMWKKKKKGITKVSQGGSLCMLLFWWVASSFRYLRGEWLLFAAGGLLSWSEGLLGGGQGRGVGLSLWLSCIAFTNKLLGNKSLKDKHGMAISTIDIPDVRTGETGGSWRGISILLWIWKASFQGVQAVLFLHCTSVDTGSLMLLQVFDGDHVAGVVFATGHLFGFLGVLSPAGCQVVLKSAERDSMVRVVRANF